MRQSLRFEVFQRDGFRCRYCGRSADEGAKLQADHIHPKSKGGLDTLANLVTACWDCNIGKRARVLRPIPKARHPRRMFPAIAPYVEEPPLYEVGAHCSTPLKIAAIGVLFGIRSYAGSHKYVKHHASGQSLPPMRKADAGWYRYCQLNHEPAKILMAGLHIAITGEVAA